MMSGTQACPTIQTSSLVHEEEEMRLPCNAVAALRRFLEPTRYDTGPSSAKPPPAVARS